LRKEKKYFSKRNFGGGSLMFWGAFKADGTVALVVLGKRLKSNNYQEVLNDNLLPIWNSDLKFLQDNASIHVSKSSKAWFRKNKIELIDHPPVSPDLNPMENLWGMIVRSVYKDGRQYKTVNELSRTVFKAWDEIPQYLLHKLAMSMPNRIFEVISKHGGPISY
jgi:transposase